MSYPDAAWERAMTVQEVMLKALSGEIHWFRAADILGMSARTLRRWRERYEQHGYVGLVDKRRHRPSVRRVAAPEVARLLRLYRERYRGFNVRHFHELARRDHGVRVSYSFLKDALQTAGRREPRACLGELLHLDGSPHAWFALAPERRATLIAVPDDATNQVLHAALYPSETTHAVMTALWAVFERHGLPLALYTDRAHWAVHTPSAKGPVDKTHLTQVGRALAQLGIENIPAYSPQARGRSERLNRTFQDRLVNELRVAGITTLEAANRYLAEVFVPHHNATFARPPRDATSAFVPVTRAQLAEILCHEERRVVAGDNTVTLGRQVLQVRPQPGRRTCAGLRVTARRYLDGTFSVWHGTQVLGRFTPSGQPVDAAAPVDARTEPGTSTRRLDRRPRPPAAHKRPQALMATL
jgi:transposase